jgi:Flp pilus assembly protein TadD
MSSTTPQTDAGTERALQTALQHYRAGRLAETEAICRQILQTRPGQADAMHLLGMAVAYSGNVDAGIELIRRAITLKPTCEYCIDLGMVWVRRGAMEEAAKAFQEAVRLNPHHAGAFNNLGIVLAALGRNDEATEAYRRGIKIGPGIADLHNNMGKLLMDMGRPAEAIDVLKRALRCRADYPEALNNFANALKNLGRNNEAVDAYRKAIRLKPDFAEAHNNLGIVHFEQARFKEAVAEGRIAVALRPDYADAYNNLANALREIDRVDEAASAYQQGIRLDPAGPESHRNLGVALVEKGTLAEAMAAYDQALRLNPDSPETRTNRSLLLLLKGDFKQGWREYEWRWRTPDFLASGREFPQPVWKGEELHGRRVLLHPEQGMGDIIQFIRYAPLIVERGGHPILRCPPDLSRVMRSMPELELAAPDAAIETDLHCPILGLPLAFGTDIDSIPRQVPYLHADPALAEVWKNRVALPDRRRVGLVWAGRAAHKNDRRRSMTLKQLAPLAEMREAQFFSLQKGDAAAQAAAPPAGMELIDLTADLHDFADTAALIANLDLVITVDTSVAHLAGAMGRPVWVLLPFNPDWRWMLEREDSPWYPTLRLFRQKTPGDWAGVVERVREAVCSRSPVLRLAYPTGCDGKKVGEAAPTGSL